MRDVHGAVAGRVHGVGDFIGGGTTLPHRMHDGISKAVLQAIPQHRMAMPEEIANMILFLASSESSFMTGSIIDIDGGQQLVEG